MSIVESDTASSSANHRPALFITQSLLPIHPFHRSATTGHRLFHHHQLSTAAPRTRLDLRVRRKCTDARRRRENRIPDAAAARASVHDAAAAAGLRRLTGPAAARRRRLRRNVAANWAAAVPPTRPSGGGLGAAAAERGEPWPIVVERPGLAGPGRGGRSSPRRRRTTTTTGRSSSSNSSSDGASVGLSSDTERRADGASDTERFSDYRASTFQRRRRRRRRRRWDKLAWRIDRGTETPRPGAHRRRRAEPRSPTPCPVVCGGDGDRAGRRRGEIRWCVTLLGPPSAGRAHPCSRRIWRRPWT